MMPSPLEVVGLPDRLNMYCLGPAAALRVGLAAITCSSKDPADKMLSAAIDRATFLEILVFIVVLHASPNRCLGILCLLLGA